MPVARPLGHCQVVEITGAPFYVIDFVEGTVLHSPESARQDYDEQQRRRAGESCIEVLADLHEVDPVKGLYAIERGLPLSRAVG